MNRFAIDFLQDYSETSIIAELQRLAAQLGTETLSRADIDESGRVSSAVVLKRFGSLRQALQAAGLKPSRFMKATEAELLDILEESWVRSEAEHGRRPERSDLRAFGCPVSSDTIVRRFGSWRKALLAVAERADSEGSAEHTPLAPIASIERRRQREALSVRLRFLVLKRDRYTCRLCSRSGVQLEVDHILPFAKGGSDSIDNLQTLCFDCNRGKRDSTQ